MPNRREIATFLLMVSLPLVAASAGSMKPASRSAHSWSVHWQPKRILNGSPVLLQVSSPQRLESLSGKWLDHEVFFSFNAPSKTWRGFAGASLETKPGKYALMLTGKTKSGSEISFEQAIPVSKA